MGGGGKVHGAPQPPDWGPVPPFAPLLRRLWLRFTARSGSFITATSAARRSFDSLCEDSAEVVFSRRRRIVTSCLTQWRLCSLVLSA